MMKRFDIQVDVINFNDDSTWTLSQLKKNKRKKKAVNSSELLEVKANQSRKLWNSGTHPSKESWTWNKLRC
jgi:hypothetical protein